MNLVKDRNAKGYDITMNQLWSESKRFNFELPSDEPPKRSAFSQARNKLEANVVKKLIKKSVNEFEDLYDYKYRWKSHRVFAVDGTEYTLPASEDLIKRFGRQNCGNVDAHYPQTSVSVLFNVKSKLAYDLVVEDVKANEREGLKKLCKSLKCNDLIILDRGYPSYEILKYLFDRKIQFLIRNPVGQTFKFVEDFLEEDIKDKIIEITIERKKYKLRLIKTGDDSEKVFLTSLLDQRYYTYEDICNLYDERWEIEEHYKVNKELFKVENFHSKNENGILQEIYSQLLLSNITRLLMNEADKENILAKDEPSFKNAVYVVERYFNEIILCNNENKMKELFEDMLVEIKRVRYKKIKDRHYPRRSYKVVSKWTRKKA